MGWTTDLTPGLCDPCVSMFFCQSKSQVHLWLASHLTVRSLRARNLTITELYQGFLASSKKADGIPPPEGSHLQPAVSANSLPPHHPRSIYLSQHQLHLFWLSKDSAGRTPLPFRNNLGCCIHHPASVDYLGSLGPCSGTLPHWIPRQLYFSEPPFSVKLGIRLDRFW